MDFITEDFIIETLSNYNAILITRRICNIDKVNFDKIDREIFVGLTAYDHIINKFFNEVLYKFKFAIKLVLLESDEYKLSLDQVENPLIKKIYGWNIPFKHEKIIAIPLGLNLSRQGITLNGVIRDIDLNKKERLVNINFSPHTNKCREKLIEKKNNEWKNFVDDMQIYSPINTFYKKSFTDAILKIDVTDPNYYKELSLYKFVLCPPGAGIDTHRLWESLYLNCIPIVEKSNLNDLYEDLPILVVNNWNEINEDYLNNKYEEIEHNKKNNKYNMKKITLKYWINILNNE